MECLRRDKKAKRKALKMQKILENWNNFLTEKQDVYSMQLVVKAEPGTKLYGRIFEAIRGIQGVTVIRSAKKIEKDENGNKIMFLDVRFYVDSAFVSRYVYDLKNAISSLSDMDGDEIISVKVYKSPQKDDTFT